jgi:group II intron reverse transcriptase/maturase
MNFGELKTSKAPGIDGTRLEEYEVNKDTNIRELVDRMKLWKYRPQPTKRAYIPKGNGDRRPLGIPTIKDKVVQMGIKKILEAIFETDFSDVSYGFRPNRNCHQALDVPAKAVMTKPVNVVVDMDIEKFFDTIDHKWLMKCLEQRIADRNLLRLIGRFLKAGVMEDGKFSDKDKGSPQGGILSPVLANIYLHFILDLWFERHVKRHLKGYTCLIRYADDFVVCFQNDDEAKAFGEMLRQRFDKTRHGKFKLGLRTAGSKFRQKMKAANLWLKGVRNLVELKQWWRILRKKMVGHYNYYGISGNTPQIRKFYQRILSLVYKWINRRSQKKSYNWEQFGRFLKYNPLPRPKIYHLTYILPSY